MNDLWKRMTEKCPTHVIAACRADKTCEEKLILVYFKTLSNSVFVKNEKKGKRGSKFVAFTNTGLTKKDKSPTLCIGGDKPRKQ